MRTSPVNYSPELAMEIARRIAEGEPLAVICREPGMPARRSVSRWRKQYPDFDELMAEARDDGYDLIASRIRKTARGRGPEDGGDSTGDVQRDKLIIDTDLKLLAKWDPLRYGDKLAIGGAPDLPAIRSERDLSEAELLAIAKAAAAQEGVDG